MMRFLITPIVITQRLQLNSISEADTVNLLLLRSNKEVTQFIQRDLPTSIFEIENFILQNPQVYNLVFPNY